MAYLEDKKHPPKALTQLVEKNSNRQSHLTSDHAATEFVMQESGSQKEHNKEEHELSMFSPNFLDPVHIKSMQHNSV